MFKSYSQYLLVSALCYIQCGKLVGTLSHAPSLQLSCS